MLRELKALPGGNGIELGLELQVRVCQRSEGDWSRESGIWMVHVGVDIPKMEAGTGVSRASAEAF